MKTDLRVRKLTDEEQTIYGGAVIRAVEIVPAFRDAVALIRPFYDPKCATAYTDAFARVGLSKWFFESLNPIQRASVILHECMHVLNSHIIRWEELGNQGKIMNFAGDFEINSGLDTLPKVDLPYAIFPDKGGFTYPRFQSMEQYFHMLKRDFDNPCPEHGPGSDGESGGQGDSSSIEGGGGDESSEGEGQGEGQFGSSGSGGGGESKSDSPGGGGSNCTCDPSSPKGKLSGNPCDEATEERSQAADVAGIERASEIEQTLAKKNTNARIVEEIIKAKSRGDGFMDDFLTIAQRQMQPSKVSWQSIFRRVISKMNDAVVRGRADYSYRRTNRRAHGSEFIFPGMVQYTPRVMFGIDTSGSMSTEDYNHLLNEIEGIIRALSKGKDSLQVFTIDTRVNNIAPVSSVKQIKLYGGGGTDMSVGWQYVNSLPKKKLPDIFILATDGFTDWNRVEHELVKSERNLRSVVLITNKNGFETVSANVKDKAVVIDISG